MELTALEELEEFKRELQQVVTAENAGETEPTRNFRKKWFGRYPQFWSERLSAFRCTNALRDHLENRAYYPTPAEEYVRQGQSPQSPDSKRKEGK